MLHHFTDLDHQLAVGSFPHAPEHVALLADQHAVGAVVCLQSDEDLEARGLRWPVMWQLYVSRRLRVSRVPVRDFDRADLERQLDAIVEAIQRHVAAGRKTYVHCNAGINRSPSSVIAWCVAHRGQALDQATRWLSERHRAVPYPDVLARWARRHGLPAEADPGVDPSS